MCLYIITKEILTALSFSTIESEGCVIPCTTYLTPLISHNAPYLPTPRQSSHNRFSFPLGITAVLREFENDADAKFWRANKVYYGGFASGVKCRTARIRGPKTLTFKTAGLRAKSLL